MIKLMIAENNEELNLSYCKFLAMDKDIKIVSSTLDGQKTLEEYKKMKPDVLLLDLDISKINGIEIIDTLCQDIKEKNKCNIIVITGNLEMRYNLLNTAKVYKIVPKPIKIEDMLETIKEITISNGISEKKLRKLFLDLKFNLFSQGTIYLLDAINIAYNNPFMLYNMKDIYNDLGNMYNVNPNKIKWSIRNSIETMNRTVSSQKLISIFPAYDTYIKITPKYFISLILEYFLYD